MVILLSVRTTVRPSGTNNSLTFVFFGLLKHIESKIPYSFRRVDKYKTNLKIRLSDKVFMPFKIQWNLKRMWKTRRPHLESIVLIITNNPKYVRGFVSWSHLKDQDNWKEFDRIIGLAREAKVCTLSSLLKKLDVFGLSVVKKRKKT